MVLQILDENLVPIETGPQNPYQVVEGQNFQFFVENRKGALPQDLQMEYQTIQGSQSRGKVYSEPLRIVSVPDPQGINRDLGTGSIVISNKSVRLRATGGDDRSMNWMTIVSVPPTILELQEVILTPPAYSQRAVEILPTGIGNFKALIGTRIDIKGSSNKLLKSADLRIKDQEPISIKLDSDRKHFSVQFFIQEPGTYSYWFELENDQGFRPPHPQRFEITAIADAVPEVFLEDPQTDLQVTPTAQIPLTVSIHDDLKIASALIRYQKSSRDESLSRALRTDRETQTFPLPFNPQSSSEQLIINHEWNLADLSLTHGDRVIFRAEATDHYQPVMSKTVEKPHDEIRVGTSISRVLTIVTPQYKTNELANRQAHLLEELARVLKDQRLLHTEVKDVQHQLQRVGRARSEEVDTIKQVEMDQKRVASQLFSPRTGLEQRSKELMQELKWNRIDDPAMKQRLAELNTELSQLNQKVFPQIQEQITQARKKLQSNVDSETDEKKPSEKSLPQDKSQNPNTPTKQSSADASPLTALNTAEREQQRVIDRLDAVLKSLSHWQKTRDLVSELDEQIQQQAEIQSQTEKLAKKTITKSFNNLRLQEQADLEKLATRQEQQAENFKGFRNLLDTLNSQASKSSQSEQLKNQEAMDFLRKKSIPEEMRQTAERLKQNQVGQALQEQQQIQQAMETLKNIFENQSADSTDQMLKKLKQTEQKLSQLKQQQQEILKKLQSARASKNQAGLKKQLQQLVKQEQELQKQLKQFEQQLQRLSLQQAGQSVQRAGNRLSKSTEALQQGQSQQAEQEIRESLDDLEQAQRELAARRQEIEESLAFEEFAKLESEIKNLIERQDAVIQETNRLEQERLSRGRWSRGQLKSLRQLLETEQDLQQETEAVAQKLAAAPVFVLAMEKVIDQLTIAVERLDQRFTDQQTLTAEQSARSKLSALLKILEEKSSLDNAQLDQNQSAPGSQAPPTDQIALLSQLKLLKLLQEEILNRTRSFNNSISDEKQLTPEQIQQRKDLSREQAELADLSMELLLKLEQADSNATDSEPEIP